MAQRSHEYELGHTDRELRRLRTQAELVDRMTREFFIRAGLVAGMRVLDIGSGGGDVAFLAADLVGSSGEVVGTDRSPEAVKAAQAGAKSRSLGNVSFRLGDPATVVFDRTFDAIVGRYVLMFSADPVAMLKGIIRNLRHRQGNDRLSQYGAVRRDRRRVYAARARHAINEAERLSLYVSRLTRWRS
jgi:ubiquinone/menaquinone biosynthesis C-methylase UbiE